MRSKMSPHLHIGWEASRCGGVKPETVFAVAEPKTGCDQRSRNRQVVTYIIDLHLKIRDMLLPF